MQAITTKHMNSNQTEPNHTGWIHSNPAQAATRASGSRRLKSRGLLLLAVMLSAGAAAAEDAAAVARREEFLSWKFGLFIHFGMATYHERQWATGTEDPASFAPSQLDCNQWMVSAAAAGMKYAVLTVKHTSGWGLWDSQHTTHDLTAFVNYKGG
ncbi:MAG: alpha-L-fucosidase [Verrucomicrobia bacterium]|nr:alpha-L-fucosidase [Verrucomicrobiota bacterium]